MPMLSAKVSDLYRSLAGFLSRDFLRKKEKRRASERTLERAQSPRYFQQEEPRLRAITDCGVRVERFHISSQALRNVLQLARSRSQLTQLLAPSSNYLSNGIIIVRARSSLTNVINCFMIFR